MNRFNPQYLTFLFIIFAISSYPVKSQEHNISVQTKSQTFYSGRENIIQLNAEMNKGKTLSWNLRYAGRTIIAKDQAVPASGTVELKIKFPKLKEGIVAKAELSCSIEKTGIKRILYFFPLNPFALDKQTVSKMGVGIWCPTESEALSELMKSCGVKFTQVDDIANFTGEILLISGVDFDEFSGIQDNLEQLCDKEVRVVVMPPISGTLPLTSFRASQIVLSKNDIIKEFNKKFDSEYWGVAKIADKSIKPVPYDDGIALEITGNTADYTYCEICKDKGKLIITSWDIIKQAKVSPTPLFLLKDLIKK